MIIKLLFLGDPAKLNVSYTYNLQKSLFDGYDCWVRPVILPSTKTNITLDFTLLQVIDMVGFFSINYNYHYYYSAKFIK